jgi:isoquinoline 1-oxidoreductase beta subunit
MVYASIEHPPVVRGSVKSLDDSGALAVKGVRQVVTLRSAEAAADVPVARRRRGHCRQHLGGVQGRKALKVEWNDGANASFESEAYKQQLIATVGKPQKVSAQPRQRGRRVRQGRQGHRGDLLDADAGARGDGAAAAVAEYKDGKVEVWTSTQNPQAAQETVAAALGIDKKDVTCHVTLLGGGFGRKSKPTSRPRRPICRSSWEAREGRLEPRRRHQVRLLPRDRGRVPQGRLGANGKPTALLHRSAFQADRLDVCGRRRVPAAVRARPRA